MIKIQRNNGFTLMELMIIVVIIAILAAIAVPSFQEFQKKNRLEEARAKLMYNHQFMMTFYAQHYTFKKNSTTWPDLPITKTDFFDIAFTSKAKGEKPNQFRLRATPNADYQSRENRYIEIDHSGNIKLCTPKKNVKSATCIAY